MRCNSFELSDKHRKILAWISIGVFLLLFFLVGYYVGRPALRFVSEPEKFRLWIESHGILGKIAYVGMVILQVIIAIIPGEPFEIGAGYAFGAVEGTLLSLAGATLGSMLVFLFVRRFGTKAAEIFFPKEKIKKLRFLNYSKKRDLVFFILFVLPGTPKDLLSYVAGLTDIKLSAWLLICSLGRIPSLVTSTIGGSALGTKNYLSAAIAFAAALALAAVGYFIYRKICARKEK